jgi:RNA polymerase sigma-70 factor (ECF subfamily)
MPMIADLFGQLWRSVMPLRDIGMETWRYSCVAPRDAHRLTARCGLQKCRPLSTAEANIVGKFKEYVSRNEVERMSTKAQEVALDRLLVDRIKAGDGGRVQRVVGKYWDRIYSMVHQLLRNQQDAEEVTQDAFIRAHRGLSNFRGDSAFSTWLYQIATNLARNRYWYWWRRKRDKTVSFDQPLGDDSDSATLAEIIPAEVESPDDITVTSEFTDRVASSMEKLGKKHREILILRNVQNHPTRRSPRSSPSA